MKRKNSGTSIIICTWQNTCWCVLFQMMCLKFKYQYFQIWMLNNQKCFLNSVPSKETMSDGNYHGPWQNIMATLYPGLPGKWAGILQHNQKTIFKKEKEPEIRVHAYGFQHKSYIFKQLFGFSFNSASDPSLPFPLLSLPLAQNFERATYLSSPSRSLIWQSRKLSLIPNCGFKLDTRALPFKSQFLHLSEGKK